MDSFIAYKICILGEQVEKSYFLEKVYNRQTAGVVSDKSISEVAVLAVRVFDDSFTGDYHVKSAIRPDGTGTSSCGVRRGIVAQNTAFTTDELSQLVLEIERLKAEKK